MENIRVLLVDDHEVVRAGYRRLFESTDDITVVAEATDGEGAYQLYAECQPTVVVMDLTMPGARRQPAYPDARPGCTYPGIQRA